MQAHHVHEGRGCGDGRARPSAGYPTVRYDPTPWLSPSGEPNTSRGFGGPGWTIPVAQSGGSSGLARALVIGVGTRVRPDQSRASNFVDDVDVVVTGQRKNLAQDVCDSRSRHLLDLSRVLPLRSCLAGEHQVGLSQLPQFFVK